jgi:hypothetical protein
MTPAPPEEAAPVAAPAPQQTTTATVSIPVTAQVIQQQTDETWGGWFRAHFAIFVLLFMCCFMFTMIMHAAHDGRDTSMLQFLEGHSQTFVGALVGALTTGGVSQLVNRAQAVGKEKS